MKEIDKLNFRPFTRFCMSIGAVPSSYLAGLTIEEQLLWLCSYLEKEVIPTVNNNAEAVEELQNLFTQLHDYVEHYFDNLDVQEEINNKLDVMATDGTLDNIINQEIFGEINTAIDTINNTTIPGIQDEIDTINNTTIPGVENRIDTLTNNNYYKIIMIGDSYGHQQFEASPITRFFWDMFRESLNLTLNTNFFTSYIDGASFKNGNFLQALVNLDNTIDDKDEITDIFIQGGWNDSYNDISENQILAGIQAFDSYVHLNYPKARISLAHVGYSNPYITDSSANVSYIIKSTEAYKKGANTYGWRYLNGCEYILHNYDNTYWQADGVHPSQLGQDQLGNYLTEAFLTGNINVFRKNEDTGATPTASGITTNINARSKLIWDMDNNFVEINNQQDGMFLTLDGTTALNCNGANSYQILTVNCPYWFGWNTRNSVTQPIALVTGTGSYPGQAQFIMKKGKLWFTPVVFKNNAILNETAQYLYMTGLNMKCPTRFC